MVEQKSAGDTSDNLINSNTFSDRGQTQSEREVFEVDPLDDFLTPNELFNKENLLSM